ncbi:MAG: sigma-70 family RNA polymerase sigma factor [Acidobacteria bacterium]|nr:sigma-70 family RNA polymerase sigma factor [Acidobacteriota bacterium]
MAETLHSDAAEELQSLAGELFASSGAGPLGLSREGFGAVLQQVRRKYLPETAGSGEVRELWLSLRVEDLALAQACAEGHDAAWEKFLLRFREKLYDIAAYIAKESSAAREMADSLYADLYGTTTREGKRVCKLSSYTGRGSLEGWLRTVLAQEYVNRYRKTRRLVSLEEESEESGLQLAAPQPEEIASVDPRLASAVDEALAALSAEDRFVLAAYYLDGRTLAEIARSLRVHESTISRKVDKLAKSLRKQTMAALMRQGLSRRQAEEALQVDVRDLQLNLRQSLTQEVPAAAFSKKKAEAPAGEGPA